MNRRCSLLVAVVLSAGTAPAAADPAATAKAAPVLSEYQRKLAEYVLARQLYAAEAKAYWNAVAEKRRARFAKRRNGTEVTLHDYVLTQPPVYSGPRRPVDPSAPPAEVPPSDRPYIPVVADFLKAAAEHFDFVPQRPANELAFKRAYVQAAAAAGLTKDQVVRIYSFESGGDGRYDVQAGRDYNKGSRAISTALGYNQLLATNTVSILAVHGDRIVKTMERRAAQLADAAKARLKDKIATLRRMIDFCRTAPVRWSEHEELAKTPRGLAVHALNLDIDVGPLLQTQKLVDSVTFARHKGLGRPLTAAELELMNFTGDGNGFDMVTMPAEIREKVPTANFFRQVGYERNPIGSRHNVVAKLIAAIDAKMDREVKRQGAKDMAAAFP
jgi:hypothetical protein